MKSYRCLISLLMAFIAASIYGLKEFEIVTSVLLAVLIHESGHILAIYTVGMKVTRIGLELSGLKIEYSGSESGKPDLVSALAGPIAGVVYYAVAIKMSDAFHLSAQLSLLYSLFNLLPVYPLDGGRAVLILAKGVFGEEQGSAYAKKLSRALCAVFVLFGLICFFKGEGGAMLASGIWLAIMQSEN